MNAIYIFMLKGVRTDMNEYEYVVYALSICIVSIELSFLAIPLSIGAIRIWKARRTGPSLRLLAYSFTGSIMSLASQLRDNHYLRRAGNQKFQPGPRIIQEVQKPTKLIIWLHGSWKNENCRDESDLVEALKNKFQSADIIEYKWLSRNLQLDRHIAANELSHYVHSAEKYSGLPVRLIGHSHGGSVALKVGGMLQQHFDVRVITLATPFISCDAASFDENDSISANTAAQSAQVIYSFPALAFGLIVAWAARLTNVSVLPPIEGMIGKAGSDMMTALFLGVFFGLAFAYFSNFQLARLIYIATSGVQKYFGEPDYVQQLVILKGDDDPLLDLMNATSGVYQQRISGKLMGAKITEESYMGSITFVLIDFTMKIFILIGLVYTCELEFRLLLDAMLMVLPITWWRQIIWLDSILVVTFPFFIFWRFPAAQLVTLGAILTRYALALLPSELLLTVAQARFSGVPIFMLLAGRVRISDAPTGRTVEVMPSNGELTKKCILSRHTAMLKVKSVIDRVLFETS